MRDVWRFCQFVQFISNSLNSIYLKVVGINVRDVEKNDEDHSSDQGLTLEMSAS